MRAAALGAVAALALASRVAADPRVAPAPRRGAPSIGLQPVVSLPGQAITTVTHAGDGSGRLFVTVRSGSIRIVQSGSLLPTPFLSSLTPAVYSTGFEQGLLGLAFHPDYETNGRFYVYYNAQPDGHTVLARYTRSASDPNQADPASAAVLLDMPQPNENHNGGDLRFGPDGYLYIAKGDGGGGGDEARDLSSLLGKMLRIDVDSGSPYGIPPSNPFLSTPGARPEIWARGLRNPWRFSFDRQTGDMFIGDVGQDTWEEVDFEPAGSPGGVDYGWNVMEGPQCYLAPTCNQAGLTLPILYYGTPDNGSVIGGSRYRGSAFPGLNGVYFYGDLGSGQIWAAEPSGPGTWSGTPILSTGLFLGTVGEDEAGELYVGDVLTGDVYRIVQVGGSPALALGDVTVTEGDAGSQQVVFTATLAPPATGPVTVDFTTADDTAVAGADYTTTSGTLTFAAGATSATIPVAVLGDVLDEIHEQFAVLLSNVTGGAILADDQGVGTIQDNDPAPHVSVGDVAVTEGNAGTVNAVFSVSLSAVSGRDVLLDATTAAGTATPGQDYNEVFAGLLFLPGETVHQVMVPVLGDTLDEPDERFRMELIDLDGAVPGQVLAHGRIRDDDGGPRPLRELRHRSSVRTDLSPLAGPMAREDLYLLSQQPFSSYEVVVDAASGDLGAGGTGPGLDLVDNDLTSVVLASSPAGLGPARSLRFENDQAAVNEGLYVRVRSEGCTTDCGADDVYRVRAYDTTLAGPRFNNALSQVTVLILQNASRETVDGHVSFWGAGGALVAGHSFTLDPFASAVVNTSAIPGAAGVSGSLTVSHTAPYGTLTGKTVALEPATGFSFDASLGPRP